MDRQTDYVTVISTGYLEPIFKLFESIERFDQNSSNEVQASSTENSFASSIVILSVTMLESVIRRTQYCRKENDNSKNMDYLRKTFSEYDFLSDIEEIIVLRDVLVHNHIWEAKIYWDDSGQLRLMSAEKVSSYQDKKYINVLDYDNRCTRMLKLNLFPTKVCKNDAIIVFKKIIHFLNYLEGVDRRYVYITNQKVQYFGKLMNVMDFTKIL